MAGPDDRDEESARSRNFVLLAAQVIAVRIGWIFKTESVIMPAFMDGIAGAGWMRGLLPVLNRVGQSVPAFLLAARMTSAPRKKHLLAAATFAMALPFLALGGAAAWLGLDGAYWPALFLALYFAFWCASGLGMVLTGTLQGKLVQPRLRGRLISASIFGSVIPATALAWWVLPDWLESATPRYDWIFGLTGVFFVVAAGVALTFRESSDEGVRSSSSFGDQVRGAFQILRDDRDYRRTVVVATLFSSSVMVFPHYQALGRERLELAGASLMVWVVVQNLSMGMASLVMGPLADRFGNRFALRVLTTGAAGIPLFAFALTRIDPAIAQGLFLWIFVGIGLVPIGFRVITNYLLEIAPADDHPRYLSLNQLCTAAAFLASPLFGLLIDVTSFEVVFLLSTGLLGTGALLTFRLVEPRDRPEARR